MRSLLLINPNTTVAMTDQMAAVAARLLPDGVALEALTAERRRAGDRVPGVLRGRRAGRARSLRARRAAPIDAVMIGCFGDPGLEALRAVAREPVLGLAEASIREADALAEPFAILTMGKAWIEILNERVALASVRTPFVGVFAGEGQASMRRRQGAVVDELDRLARTGRRRRRAHAHSRRRGAHGNGEPPEHGGAPDRLRGGDGPVRAGGGARGWRQFSLSAGWRSVPRNGAGDGARADRAFGRTPVL